MARCYTYDRFEREAIEVASAGGFPMPDKPPGPPALTVHGEPWPVGDLDTVPSGHLALWLALLAAWSEWALHLASVADAAKARAKAAMPQAEAFARVEARKNGAGRDEMKEFVETNPLVIQCREAIAEASTRHTLASGRAKSFQVMAEAASREITRRDQERFGEGRRM